LTPEKVTTRPNPGAAVGIDEALGCGRRGLRSAPGRLLLGPTGARLWADVLDEAPGFVGAIDLVHKLNIPLLFTTTVSPSAVPGPPAEVQWRPSHLTMKRKFGTAVLTERKFISWDDVAVSEQSWTNSGPESLTLTLDVDSDWCGPVHEGVSRGRRRIETRDFTIISAVTADEPKLWSGLELGPGESRTVVVAAALGLAESDSVDELVDRARAALLPDAVDRQRADYQTWFDATPKFTSSDPVLDRLWNYRWFLLRHNLAEPRAGALTGPVVYEGRSHKMTKEPWHPQGWEFSKHIPLSTPMHVVELRWHHDLELAASAVRSVIDRQGEDGQFYSATANEVMHPYANFMGWAAWQYTQLHGFAPVADAMPALKRQVRGERENLVPSEDELPVQFDHRLTGKEYQPSYWYFAGYPDDPKDPRGYTPLKRVDRAIYHYLNALGVARLCAQATDPDQLEFEELAERIAASVLSKQWDANGEFFYDLHHQTDQRALVRNVVGFYPWWAGIPTERHRAGFQNAFDATGFGSPWPLPSVEVECPVYQPAGSWKGAFLKGRNGCMWDGPTWPYTNSVVLDAIARESRRAGHQFDGLFADILRRYTLMHFNQHDGRTPYLVEHYDSQTGEPISDEPDYNHSYLIDLMVRHVAGLSVEVDDSAREIRIEVDPLSVGLDHFQLDDVRVAGRVLTVSYSSAGGLVVLVDGVPRATRQDLGYLALQLPR
jgi:hypothetical protein